MSLAKRLVARLPDAWQLELRRHRYAWQIRQGGFDTPEPEYWRLSDWIRSGDWVLDIGANVGHYTKRLSDLVGEQGRVIAFEPVPATFHLLAANARLFQYSNVTLINAAASDQLGMVRMAIPTFSTGLTNYFQAHVSSEMQAGLSVLSFPIDSLSLKARVSLVKIDAEGHESFVLQGMQRLLVQHRPTLIIETSSPEIVAALSDQGYVSERLPDSPNILFQEPSPG